MIERNGNFQRNTGERGGLNLLDGERKVLGQWGVERFERVGGKGGKGGKGKGGGGGRGGYVVLLSDQVLLLRREEEGEGGGEEGEGEEGRYEYEGVGLGEVGVVSMPELRERNALEIRGVREGGGGGKGGEFGPILGGGEEGKVVVVFEGKVLEEAVRKEVEGEIMKRERRRVFGVELKLLLKNDQEREEEEGEGEGGESKGKEGGGEKEKITKEPGVPVVVKELIEFLEEEARETEGLFRVAGTKKVLEQLREKIDQGGKTGQELRKKLKKTKKGGGGEEGGVHTVAQLLKLFFRLLPEPLLTFDVYDDLIHAEEEYGENTEAFQAKVYALLSPIPWENRILGRYLVEFLAGVGKKGEINKMYPPNLAICFAPNLLRPRQHSINAALDVMKVNRVVEGLIVCPEILSREEEPSLWKGEEEGLVEKE